MLLCCFISLLKSVKVPEFARAGGVAIEDVTLSAGLCSVSLCVSCVVHVCIVCHCVCVYT